MARIRTVGTAAVLLAADNPQRQSWRVIMPDTSKEAGNVGTVFVGLGFIPTPTFGTPSQGFALQAGNQIGDQQAFKEDTAIYRGSIWAVASVAGQRVWVDESIGPVG